MVTKSQLSRKLIDAHARLPLLVLLAIEFGLRIYMSDLHSKFEEDCTKAVVAIVDEGIADRHTQTDIQMDIHSSYSISVQCHALH